MNPTDSLNPWVQQYQKVVSIKEIRLRAYIGGQPIERLGADPIEVACSRLTIGLKAIFVPTIRCCEIIRDEIERALAHAQIAYPSKKAVMQRIYDDFQYLEIAPYIPTCITGPAGTGKTQIARAIGRVLNKSESVKPDIGHGQFPLTAYITILMSGKKSVSSALRPLAKPEIASGHAKCAEDDLPKECAEWQYKAGLCLYGLDELQFMAQSENASVLLTKTLLAHAEIRIPWHFIANYSLCWKLARRPQEAKQRILGRPIILLPDSPTSKDWLNVLEEYQIVVNLVFGFELVKRSVELWNFSAGLKRELIKLLISAYRICRLRGGAKVVWSDIEMAYSSIEFCDSRRDVELLIAHAAQGGDLREDLRCPFVGGAIATAADQYRSDLCAARATKVAIAVVDAALTDVERKIVKAVRSRCEPSPEAKTAEVLKMVRPKRRNLKALQQAGRQFRESTKRHDKHY